ITAGDFDYYNSQFQVSSTDPLTRFDGVVIAKGESTARIYFGAVSDAIVEGNEKISVEIIPYNIDPKPTTLDDDLNKVPNNSKYGLRDSTGAIVGSLKQDIFIQDSLRYKAGFFVLGANNRLIGAFRDGAYISFDNIQPDVSNGATIFLRPSSQPLTSVTLKVKVSGKTLTWDATNWETAQSLTLSNLSGNSIDLTATASTSDLSDLTYNGDLTFKLQLGTPREDYLLLAESPLSDKQKPVIPQVSLLVSDRLIENQPDIPANVIIRLSDPAPVGGLKLYLKVTGGTAKLGEDYTVKADLAPSVTPVVSPGVITTSQLNSPTNEGRDKAFDDKADTKWLIFNSTGWLQYQFGNNAASAVNQYSLTSANDANTRDPKNWKILGSNDGVNFVLLDQRTGEVFSDRGQTRTFSFVNTTAYKYYRFDVSANNGAAELQLAEWKLFGQIANLVPSPIAGTVSASSGTKPSPTAEVSTQAFDANSATKWLLFNPTGFLQYQFENSTANVVNQYSLTSANDEATRDPKDWRILGSNDGTTFVELDKRTGESFSDRKQTRSFSFVNTTAYKFYKLDVTANNGATDILQLADWQLFGLQPTTANQPISNVYVITVPEGQQTFNLPLNAIDDLVAEGTETIEVTLVAHDDTKYRVAPDPTQSKVTMSLIDDEQAGIEIKSVSYVDKFQEFKAAATNPLSTITSQTSLTFADLDRDGDVDGFGIDAQGKAHFFENTDASAAKNTPQFTENETKNPLKGITGSQIVFADLDRDGRGIVDVGTGANVRTAIVDGDLDALAVQADGSVIYYENTDTSELRNTPNFQRNDAKNPFAGKNLGVGSK
ncbi:MAG: discoidin domain-containing protein, partial [Pseudanabaena sp.]